VTSRPEPQFLQLQNAKATANLLEQLGITAPIRFDVLPTVIPVAVITDPDPAKHAKLAYGATPQAGVAAQNTIVQLFNPAGSGVIVHADSCLITAVTADSIQVREHDTALTFLSALTGYRDRRLPGAPVAQCRTETNAVVPGAQRLAFDVPANEALLIPLDTFLGAGQGVTINMVTVNITLFVSWYWEETALAVA